MCARASRRDDTTDGKQNKNGPSKRYARDNSSENLLDFLDSCLKITQCTSGYSHAVFNNTEINEPEAARPAPIITDFVFHYKPNLVSYIGGSQRYRSL